MAPTKLLGSSLLLLPLLSPAAPVELQADAGMYQACTIRTAGAGNVLDGSFRIVATSPDPKWASMIAVAFEDPDGKPFYRVAVMSEVDPPGFGVRQTFVFGPDDYAQERLGPARVGEDVPFHLRWDAEGWITVSTGQSSKQFLTFSRKPARVRAVVSGATARLDLPDGANLDCGADEPKRPHDPSIEEGLVGTWEGVDETGTTASLRLQADGYAFMTRSGQTLGGHNEAGLSLRYEIDAGQAPMWLDFIAEDAAGKELRRFKMNFEMLGSTSLRVSSGLEPSSRPDPKTPGSTKYSAVLNKVTAP